MVKSFFSMLMLLGYLFLVGCGTQGPLYIPEQRYPQKAPQDNNKTPDVAPSKQTTP